jgi:hypothetical protein
LGGESKAEEPRRVHTNFPHQIPKSKNNREQHNKALRNHAESSIHTKEVHTRPSLPPDHPTLSLDLTMKRSSWSYGNLKKIGRENRKANELGFQEVAAILSPHGLYVGSQKSKISFINN